MNLKDGLSHYSNLSPVEIDKSLSLFTPEKLRAKEYFLKQGKVSDKIGFLEFGMLRSFFYDENGNDITTHFFQPGQIIISMRSFNAQLPSKENIMTIEESSLLVITYKNMIALYEKIPVWREITKMVDEHKFNQLNKRSIQLQTLSALERYQLFCEKNPLIIKSVPLRYIASYLGIDIATLSRIRKKI
ncbi:MAG: hypothetical protein A2W99_00055 [Bacteroidetes bacterium GWF2_33_16]|nr:MAG: hypothetical protein A2X00_02760 [Bacteroidetes bacterium GWE2_32_14]OFY08669.1 MAG: hypothetical protein A2W99_00055 [Bacteroidetes bacterium GWF2_33_16]